MGKPQWLWVDASVAADKILTTRLHSCASLARSRTYIEKECACDADARLCILAARGSGILFLLKLGDKTPRERCIHDVNRHINCVTE